MALSLAELKPTEKQTTTKKKRNSNGSDRMIEEWREQLEGRTEKLLGKAYKVLIDSGKSSNVRTYIRTYIRIPNVERHIDPRR